MKKTLTLFLAVLPVFLFVTLDATFSKNQNPARQLLIVADDAAPMEALTKGLQSKGNYNIQYNEQDNLAENLSSFHAVFMYIHTLMTPRTEKILIQYAQQGGRLIILHHGIASGRIKNPDWLKLTGIYMAPRNHPTRPWKVIANTTHTMVNLQPNHYITSHQVKYDRTIEYKSSDSPSQPESFPALDLKNTEVFLNQQFTDGREKTVLFGLHCVDPDTGNVYQQDRCGWYKHTGKGWVFYYQPGHSAGDFEHPAFLQIILNTLTWQPESFALQDSWRNPLIKHGRLGSPLVEVTPFVFKDRLYLLESNQKFWDVPGKKPGDFFHEDTVRIRDIEKDKIISVPLVNHAFATAFVWKGRVYVFAGDYGRNKPWRNTTEINMTSSDDLINWSKPQTVLHAEKKEFLFNTAVCRGKNHFVLLYETNESHWPVWTFKYCRSDDLIHWERIPNAIYGRKKYVGGPALYYEGDFYYTLYLERLPDHKGFETRITRSRDLLHWQDAPANRPFITFDSTHKNIPLRRPEVCESNASDAELCYFKGKTIVYFTGGTQVIAGDLQWASFAGTPRVLLESFFK